MRRCCCRRRRGRRWLCSPCFTNILLKIIVKLLILIVMKLWFPGREANGLQEELDEMRSKLDNPEMEFEDEEEMEEF